jgi:hypothetical protein
MLKKEIKRVENIDEALKENSLFCLGNGKSIRHFRKDGYFHVFKRGPHYTNYYSNSGMPLGDTKNEELFIYTFKRKNNG